MSEHDFRKRRKTYASRFRPKSKSAWVDKIFAEAEGEAAVIQRLVNTGEIGHAPKKLQLRAKAMIDAGIIKDRPFHLGGKETW